MEVKQKEKTPELKVVCTQCGKPLKGKAQSAVTRFLSFESRCKCAEQREPALEKAADASSLRLRSAPTKSADQLESRQSVSTLSDDELARLKSNLSERYDILGLIGRGGMGAVYKVRDKELNKTFAIKVLNSELVTDKNSVKRFEQEARAARELTGANLVAVYDYGLGNAGAPYIVMDYLDGADLADVLAKEGYLDVPRALDIFIQLAGAVAHAHSKDVIHRDIKPSNIIIQQREHEVELAKLVDFGIAKVLPDESQRTQMTHTGDLFGSPLYMSPEQCLGNKLDQRSDIYELGCVMYESLTGQQPFLAENVIKTILRHINEDAPPIAGLDHDYKVPQNLERVVLRCLEREPANRYQTADDLLSDLHAIRDGKPIAVSSKVESPKKKEEGRGATFIKIMLLMYVLWLVATCFRLHKPIYFSVSDHPAAGTTDLVRVPHAKH